MDDQIKDQLPPLSQEWFDDNRERFNADTTISNIEIPKCNHFFKRINSDIECIKCHFGLMDPQHHFSILKDGTLTTSDH